MDSDCRGRKGLFGAVPLVHFLMRSYLRPGDAAIDATCGNGGDTVFLAHLVGETGRVWALDVNAEARQRTAGAVAEAGAEGRVTIVAAGHETMAEHVTGPVRGIVFNLGFLPGAERATPTTAECTVAALRAAAGILQPGGLLAVAVYPGHPEGEPESLCVASWAASLPAERFNAWEARQANRSSRAPYVLFVEKTG